MSPDTSLIIAVLLTFSACYFTYYLFLQQMDNLKNIQRKAVEGVLCGQIVESEDFIDFYEAIDFARQKSIYFLLPPTRSNRQLLCSFFMFLFMSLLIVINDYMPIATVDLIKNILWIFYSISLGAFLVLFYIDVRFAVGFRKLDKEYGKSNSTPLFVGLTQK